MKQLFLLLLPLLLLFTPPLSLEADSFTETVQTTVQADNVSTVTAESTILCTQLDEPGQFEYSYVYVDDSVISLHPANEYQNRSLNTSENDLDNFIHISFAHEPIEQSHLQVDQKPTSIGYMHKGMSNPYSYI